MNLISFICCFPKIFIRDPFPCSYQFKLQSFCLHPDVSPLPVLPHRDPPPSPLRGQLHHLVSPFCSTWFINSAGLVASSPTEVRLVSPLLHMCKGPQISCAFSLVGGSVSESSQGSRLVDTVGLPISLPLSSVPSLLLITLP